MTAWAEPLPFLQAGVGWPAVFRLVFCVVLAA